MGSVELEFVLCPSFFGWHLAQLIFCEDEIQTNRHQISMCFVVSASHNSHPALALSGPTLVPTNCSCLGAADDQPVPDTLFEDRSLPQGLPLHQHSMTIGHAHSCRVLQIISGLGRVLHAVSPSAPLTGRPHGGKLGPSACAASQSTESTTNRCRIDISATSSVMPPSATFCPIGKTSAISREFSPTPALDNCASRLSLGSPQPSTSALWHLVVAQTPQPWKLSTCRLLHQLSLRLPLFIVDLDIHQSVHCQRSFTVSCIRPCFSLCPCRMPPCTAYLIATHLLRTSPLFKNTAFLDKNNLAAGCGC